MLLDEWLPRWHFSESHRRLVAAPPERVWDELIALRGSEVRLMRMLMALRALPAVVMRRRYSLAPARDRSLLDGFLAGGFLVLARDSDEIVIGGVGRFWRPRGAGLVRLADPQQFVHFADSGFAKAAVNFHTAADQRGTLLTTETRSPCYRRARVACLVATGGSSALAARSSGATSLLRRQPVPSTPLDPQVVHRVCLPRCPSGGRP